MNPLKATTNPSLQPKGIESPTTDGLVGKLRGLFKRKAQNTAINGHEAASLEPSTLGLEHQQQIALWSNHKQIQAQIPQPVISRAQHLESTQILNTYLSSSEPCNVSINDLQTALKTIFFHVDSGIELFERYPQLAHIIPDSLYQDHIFLLALQKFKPDLFTVLTITTFRPFTQVYLFNPISNGLKNNWVVMEYLKDQKIVVMKEGLIRQTINLSDLWVLNFQRLTVQRSLFINGDQALQEFSKVMTEQQMMQRIMPEPTPGPAVSAVIREQESHTEIYTPHHAKHSIYDDDTGRTEEQQEVPATLIKYDREMLGLKFTLQHADHGTLSLIATDITSDYLTFVIIEGPYIGRYMQVEAERVTQYLVPGNPDMRFLNTNILRVKK